MVQQAELKYLVPSPKAVMLDITATDHNIDNEYEGEKKVKVYDS